MEKTEERLATGKCPDHILFNIYTNDQPLRNGTSSFIYADDLCVTAQQPSFVEVETTIEESLSEHNTSDPTICVKTRTKKQITPFHLRNKEKFKCEMEQDRSGAHPALNT